MVAPKHTSPLLSKKDSQLAKVSSQRLSQHKNSERKRDTVKLKLAGQGDVALPSAIVPLLEVVLAEMAAGRPVSVMSVESDLSTQQAAELLNVSRPFIIKLLKAKALPYRQVGTHRRLRLSDVLAYQKQMDKKADKAMQALADQAQELDMGYDKR